MNALPSRSAKMPKISILLPEEEAERFEAYCRERGFKKGTLIARLDAHLGQIEEGEARVGATLIGTSTSLVAPASPRAREPNSQSRATPRPRR